MMEKGHMQILMRTIPVGTRVSETSASLPRGRAVAKEVLEGPDRRSGKKRRLQKLYSISKTAQNHTL